MVIVCSFSLWSGLHRVVLRPFGRRPACNVRLFLEILVAAIAFRLVYVFPVALLGCRPPFFRHSFLSGFRDDRHSFFHPLFVVVMSCVAVGISHPPLVSTVGRSWMFLALTNDD